MIFCEKICGYLFSQILRFFAGSLQPVIAVSIQDYYSTETFSAPVRRFLYVRRFLLKKQYEQLILVWSFSMTEYSRISITIWAW